LQEKFSEQAIDDVNKVLDKATRKLNEINDRVLGDKIE